MNKQNIDKIYQFAVLVAGDLDDFVSSRLGPIHLLKYLYLADLCHAKRTFGESYSGIEWQFYNFGPWSSEAHARMEESLKYIHVDVNELDSKYGEGEIKRFYKKDDFLLKDIRRAIPTHITIELSKQIKLHSSDTASLLHEVYATPPMLHAAPGEKLQMYTPKYFEIEKKPVLQLAEDSLSNKAKKRLKEKLAKAKTSISQKANREELINPSPSPRYDKLYAEGLEKLNSLETEEFTEAQIEVQFDSTVWKSGARKRFYE